MREPSTGIHVGSFVTNPTEPRRQHSWTPDSWEPRICTSRRSASGRGPSVDRAGNSPGAARTTVTPSRPYGRRWTPASTGSTRRPSTGWAIRRRLSCSFVGRDGAQQIGAVGRAAEDALEGLPVFPNGCDPGHGRLQVRLAHFIRIDDRQRRLLLEGIRPAVPELGLVVERVQNRRCIALADAAVDPDGGRTPVGESAGRIMTAAASHGPISRQATVEEQFLAERNFLGGLRIVGGIAARVASAGAPTW